MRNPELEARTKKYALRVVLMYGKLPRREEARVLGHQALRSGTSVAGNYREASRARSDAELIAKLGNVEQELDETMLWLELLVDSGMVTNNRMADLLKETEELLKVVVASIKTIKRRR